MSSDVLRRSAALPVMAALAVVVLAACEPDIAGPDPLPATDTLPVLGHGVVTGRYTAEVAVRGTWAYTSTWGNRGAPGNTVFVWNVAGPVPAIVDSLIIAAASTTGDVQISDDGALLVVATEFSPGSIVIYDRTDPAHPAHVSTFTSPNTVQGVHTVKLGRVGGRHYAFLSIDPAPARLVIVDITDPANPSEVLSRNMGNPFIHDVFVRDGLLFTALWHDGVTIWDIGGADAGGTPADPVEIINFAAASGSIHNIWWFHDPGAGAQRYLFLGEEGPGSVSGAAASGDIHVIDISTMRQPQQVAIYSVPNAGTHNFWMDEPSGVLYAAYYNAGVRALDVRGDLGACTAAQRSNMGLCDLRLMGREAAVAVARGTYIWGVVHQGTHVYASDMHSGLFKIDAGRLDRD
ncbi:MAG: LVIVD repeat-containing protein [Longimicrobiales bacterium]